MQQYRTLIQWEAVRVAFRTQTKTLLFPVSRSRQSFDLRVWWWFQDRIALFPSRCILLINASYFYFEFLAHIRLIAAQQKSFVRRAIEQHSFLIVKVDDEFRHNNWNLENRQTDNTLIISHPINHTIKSEICRISQKWLEWKKPANNSLHVDTLFMCCAQHCILSHIKAVDIDAKYCHCYA